MEETVRTALITGASAGLGAAFAKRLAEDGYELILVARRLERLEALAGDLREWFEVPVEALRADLADANGLRAVEERIAGDGTLELLINNAGFPAYMPFVELPPEKAEELIRLQVLAVTRLTRAALPGMIARGRGGIVNVSSMTANSASLPPEPLPNRVTYAATKAYVNAFTELLSHELAVPASGSRRSIRAARHPRVPRLRHQAHPRAGDVPRRRRPGVAPRTRAWRSHLRAGRGGHLAHRQTCGGAAGAHGRGQGEPAGVALPEVAPRLNRAPTVMEGKAPHHGRRGLSHVM